jgi:single-strand DNA-binding protein
MNQWNGIGNLTKDPDTRQTGSGKTVCVFTVAVNRPFKNQAGDYDADFIPVVTWDALAENCSRYLSKGRTVGVTGRIQTRSYEADDGIRRYVTEIIASEVKFLSPAGGGKPSYDDDNPIAKEKARRELEKRQSGGYDPAVPDEMDDDLPF